MPCCASKDNRGWRYFIAVLGLFTLAMFICRFFLFHLLESPKFLLSRNRQAEAIDVVQRIARYNGTKTWLDEMTMQELGGDSNVVSDLSIGRVSKQSLGKFSFQKIRALFRGWRLGITTSLLWIIWLTYVPSPFLPSIVI
jgi:hypothetical protein